MTPDEPTLATDLTAENQALRDRVQALEAEVKMLRESTATTVASAQETLYWFERWGVDFNTVMAKPQAEQLRKVVRALRSVYRAVLKAKRRVLP